MKNEKIMPLFARILLFAVAAASCAYGIYSGEADTVYRKAANVCMECIGIG